MKILKFNFELHFIRNKAYHKKQNVGVCFDVTDFFIWHKIQIKMKTPQCDDILHVFRRIKTLSL